jgi:hypothetical protein
VEPPLDGPRGHALERGHLGDAVPLEVEERRRRAVGIRRAREGGAHRGRGRGGGAVGRRLGPLESLDRERVLPPAAPGVVAEPLGDAAQPPREAGRVAQTGQLAARPEERLLRGVLGVVLVAEPHAHHPVHRGVVPLDQRRERVPVAQPRAPDELIHRVRPPHIMTPETVPKVRWDQPECCRATGGVSARHRCR